MINFHKFSFLDVKKLMQVFDEKNYFSTFYDPLWMFVWSDYYKFQIAYQNDFVFIKFMMPKIGMCYYPPLNTNDYYMGCKIIEDDAKENGYDFYIGPIPEVLYYKILGQKAKMYDNRDFNSYTYLTYDLGFMFNPKLKARKKRSLNFQKKNPKVEIRNLVKEDFPSILEFIENYRMKNKIDDLKYFPYLNMIKKCMEHLYEFEIPALILKQDDEVLGFALGGIYANTCTIYSIIADEKSGAYDYLLQIFSKKCSNGAKYISVEADQGDMNRREKLEKLLPLKLEKFYATFSI